MIKKHNLKTALNTDETKVLSQKCKLIFLWCRSHGITCVFEQVAAAEEWLAAHQHPAWNNWKSMITNGKCVWLLLPVRFTRVWLESVLQTSFFNIAAVAFVQLLYSVRCTGVRNWLGFVLGTAIYTTAVGVCIFVTPLIWIWFAAFRMTSCEETCELTAAEIWQTKH